MMRTPAFRSTLAQAMTDLVAFKRLEGFDYTVQAEFLKQFDVFLCGQEYCNTSLSRQIVDAYIAHTDYQAPSGRHSRLSPVRVLSRHLHQLDPESYVLHGFPFKRPSLPRWYLYSPEDIATLLRDARSLGPAGSLRPECFHILVGLLYVTGLRIEEALALNLGDLDTTRRLLLVREGKFGKERYVVLHPTTIETVEEYLVKRNAYAPSDDSSPFFLNCSGRRLMYKSASTTYSEMRNRCNVGHDAPQRPRLHDLRHTYACNCVLKWYEEGVDVNSKLPILATAMGHVNVQSTQVYLHVTSRLLEHAAERFHGTFAATCKGE